MDLKTVLLLCTLVARGFCYPEEENNADPDLFQSDMRLSPMQRLLAETGGDVSKAGSMGGNAFSSAKNPGILWLPNKIVPYTISPQLASKPQAILAIMLAFREWESHTCLWFVERTVERDYIEFFMNCSGCWSYVGRTRGMQNICLSPGCWGKGTVTHELAHAMGFWHEQSRPDRDSHIRVVWDNIPKSKKHNFKKHDNSEVDSLGTKYDYTSVMQYSKTAFGINGSVTMDPIEPGVFQLGQRVGFTETDSYQANTLYRCNGSTTRPKDLPTKNVLKGKRDCDFDTGFCHFVQDKTDDFDFSLRIGPTPSGGTGPEVDHTTGRMGAYAFIEASSPRRSGDVARLISRRFRKTKATCLTFHYHMLSSSTRIGTLNVYIQQNAAKQLLFTRKTSSGSDWVRQTVEIKAKSSYKVIFEAVRGASYQGDISLDDVSFSNGACSDETVIQPPPSVKCSDVKDREAQYCSEWARAGFCKSYMKDMQIFCPATCLFC